MFDQLLHRTVLLDQLRRGLLPHPRDARDVVRRIALQGHVVQVLLRRETEPLLHRVDVVADDVGDALGVEHHRDARPHQLEEVPVGRHDHRIQALLARPDGEGGDEVVRLLVLVVDQGDLERLHHLQDQAELLAELIRRLAPARLVLGVALEASLGPPEVERHRDVVRPLLGQQLDEHRGEAVHGVRDLPGGGGQGLRQGEERAVGQAVPVQEEQSLAGPVPVCSLGAASVRGHAGFGRAHLFHRTPRSRPLPAR